MSNKQIESLVSKFVSDLEDLIVASAISRVAEALGSRQGMSTARASGNKSTAHAKGAKRSPEELDQLTRKLLAYIAKHPGERIEKIGLGLAISTKELNLPIKKLLAEKSISSKGQKRATTYTAR